MASGVEMSGVGAPARTAKPEVARPISVREPATSDPSFSIASITGAERIRMSGLSPAFSRS
jgi:hypothetical protein